MKKIGAGGDASLACPQCPQGQWPRVGQEGKDFANTATPWLLAGSFWEFYFPSKAQLGAGGRGASDTLHSCCKEQAPG